MVACGPEITNKWARVGGGGEDESFEVCVKENFIQFFFMFRYLFGLL
jgi:hypothetical protein